MRRRPASGGRPHKGDRSTLITRPPTPLAEAVRDEAERQGLSYSDYVANILAAAHGFPPVAAPPVATPAASAAVATPAASAAAQDAQMKLTA